MLARASLAFENYVLSSYIAHVLSTSLHNFASEILHNDGMRHIPLFVSRRTTRPRRFTFSLEEAAFLEGVLESLNVEIVESFCF